MYQETVPGLLRVVMTRAREGAGGTMAHPGMRRTGVDGALHPDHVWRDAEDAFGLWVAGDAAGLDDLVAVMTPVLWHVVRAYRLPLDDAQDVVQTTWLALVRHRAKIADPAAVGGWLCTTARREAWRVSTSGARSAPMPDEDLAPRLPEQASAEATAVDHDERDRLWEVVDRLPERCRRLLRVVAFENRPDYTRLATELDMPVGSIGPTRGRCLAKLRVSLMQVGVI